MNVWLTDGSILLALGRVLSGSTVEPIITLPGTWNIKEKITEFYFNMAKRLLHDTKSHIKWMKVPKHTFWTLLILNLPGQTAIFPIKFSANKEDSSECLCTIYHLKTTDQFIYCKNWYWAAIEKEEVFILRETAWSEMEKLPTHMHIDSQIIIAYLAGL